MFYTDQISTVPFSKYDTNITNAAAFLCRRFNHLRDRLQISLLIFNEFKGTLMQI